MIHGNVRAAFEPPCPEAINCLRQIQSHGGHARPIISVSLRTGSDYLSNGVRLPLCYYHNAAKRLVDDLGAAAFIVTGDQSAVVEEFAETLREFGPVVSSLELSPAAQLHAISLCDHAIISNSTFAWWGAWLGDEPASAGLLGRRVIAPDPWLLRQGTPIPDRWEKLAHTGFDRPPPT